MKNTDYKAKQLNAAFLKLCACLFILTFLSTLTRVNASELTHTKNPQFNEILVKIKTFYVDDLALKSADTNAGNNNELERLFAKLDPYSKYLNEDALSALFNNTSGHYTGIGIEVQSIAQHITITRVIPNSPAHAAGLQKDDIITKVNNNTITDESVDNISLKIKNSPNNKVRLAILRQNNTSNPLVFTLTRSAIQLESVTSELLNAGRGYLTISNFTHKTADEVRAHINTMQRHNGYPLEGVVIDLRNNPGGTLKSAVAVADLFLQHAVIVTTKGRFYDANQTYYARRGDILIGAPIILLINEKSASAAEILAAALQENYRAKVVGSQSFGKGSVQSIIPLGNGKTAIKLTTARYFTPSGLSLDGVGVTPDVIINQTALSQTDKIAIMNSVEKTPNTKLLADNIADTYLVTAKQLLNNANRP